MSARVGKCTNFGNCSVADSGKLLNVASNAEFVCTECGGSLIEMKKSGGAPKFLVPLVVLVVLGALGFFGVKKFVLDKKDIPDTTQVASTQTPVQTAAQAPIQQNAPATQQPAATAEVILRLHGSNTIGAALAPALAEAFLRKQGYTNVSRQQTGVDKQMLITGNMGGKVKAIEIESRGSSTAFNDLAGGRTDIGMASRKIKPVEIQNIQQAGLGDMTSQASEHVLALDGIAVIVSQSNSIGKLTVGNLRDIFTGKITNWQNVGGSAGQINLYVRNHDSGTYATFKKLVLGGAELSSVNKTYTANEALSDSVATDPFGIGFVGLPYVRSSKALSLSYTGSTPLKPSPFTVATEDYPLTRRLYLYTPQAPTNINTLNFINFALSTDGQNVVNTIGFVDLNIKVARAEDKPVQTSTRPTNEYERLTLNASQLSTNLRFRSGGDQLDNKALRDIDRLVSLLNSSDYRGKDFYLLGFTDNTGSQKANKSLSKTRALEVFNKLTEHGLTAKKIVGFGQQRPVAPNNTETGRHKNRRVEVWVAN